MILVITGRSESMQLTTNGVGIGSSLHDFFAELSSTCAHHFRSIMLHGREELLLDSGREDNPEAMLSSLARMLSIFSIK